MNGVPPRSRHSFALALALMCAAGASRPVSATQAPVVIRAPQPAQPAAQPPFDEWLAALRADALARGISQKIVDEALGKVERLPVVVERDRTQAELVLTLDTYLKRRLTPRVVRDAKAAAKAQTAVLRKTTAAYGVPASVMVAIWGLESNFGRFTGVRPTVAALATLAWDPRRSAFFRGELFDALEILNRGDIDPAAMRGSWAGAMGQPQFMPSSYLEFAQDFDGDGRRDIWSSPADVFASIANYLRGHGWSAGQSWGREVRVSRKAARRIAERVARREGTCQATRDMTIALPLSRWQQLGVRLPDGKALPAGTVEASLVGGATRQFLVYQNYDALLAYNCAHSYALGVALLADRIGSAVPTTPSSPRRASPRR